MLRSLVGSEMCIRDSIETEPALSTSRSGRQNAEYHFGMIKTLLFTADARWPISRATSADTWLSLACATASMSGSLCPPRHISSPIIRSITRTRRISFSVGFRVRGDRVGQRRRRPDNSDASSARISSEIFSKATSRCSYSAPTLLRASALHDAFGLFMRGFGPPDSIRKLIIG